MRPQLAYIELKSGYNGNGPAWIAMIEFSKTGQTVYINNKALKRLKAGGVNANHYDIETGDEYWVSGVKQNGADRHWAGHGKIMIDKRVINDYLHYTNQKQLDPAKFEVVELKQTDKTRINKLENSILTDDQYAENARAYWDKNTKKFEL